MVVYIGALLSATHKIGLVINLKIMKNKIEPDHASFI